MFTRFNVLSIVVIFVVSLVALTILFSNDGILANKSTENRINSIQEEVKQKESDLNVLRYRASSSSSVKEVGGSVIHSFVDDDVFDPAEGRTEEESAVFHGLSFSSILLISSGVTVVYGVLVLVVLPHIFKRKEGDGYGCDN